MWASVNLWGISGEFPVGYGEFVGAYGLSAEIVDNNFEILQLTSNDLHLEVFYCLPC